MSVITNINPGHAARIKAEYRQPEGPYSGYVTLSVDDTAMLLSVTLSQEQALEIANALIAVRKDVCPDAYLHINREQPDMRGVSLSHDESGYNAHYDTFPLYRHPPVGWQPIETAPKGQSVLAVAEGEVCIARYFTRHTLPAGYEPVDWAEEDEAGDSWCPEGWYRETGCDVCDVGWRMIGSNPTGWMPLPEMPV